MKKLQYRKVKIVILLAISSLLVGLSSGCVLNKNNNANNNQSANSANQSKNASAVDLEKDGQIYKNQYWHYQVKYPPRWSYRECGQDYVAFAPQDKEPPPCYTENWTPIEIRLYPGQSAAVDQQIKRYPDYDQTEIDFAGKTAIRLSGTVPHGKEDLLPTGSSQIIILLTKDGDLYNPIYTQLAEGGVDYRDIFNSMMKTFKFIPAEPSNQNQATIQ